MAPYRIIKQGYMFKEPPYSKRGMRKKLKRYWFVLLEDKKQVAFVYYKNEESYIARQRNVGFIKIDNSRINVIGDYLNYKNAYEIVTEKNLYIFASETRYELHDWIFVLHNTLEGFHRRMERVKVRVEQRQRVLSASSVNSDNHSSQASLTPTHQHVPPETTTSPALRKKTTPTNSPPNASPKTGTSSRRRPSRPAPVAPQQRHTLQQTSPAHSHDEYPRQYSNEGPTSQTTTFLHGDRDHHQVMDLEIAQMEEHSQRDEEEEEEEVVRGRGRVEEDEEEEERYVLAPVPINTELLQANGYGPPPPPPAHQRSVSDTSVLLCRTNSSSLPDLDHPSSTSPEPVADTVEAAKEQVSQDPPTKAYRTKHTRHLSLLGGNEHKRKKRRSMIRSRSPPSYPPPPPPANDESGEEEEVPAVSDPPVPAVSDPPVPTASVAPAPVQPPQRKDSLQGFSRVMATISSIDQELQDMGGIGGREENTTPNITPPEKFRGEDPPIIESPEEEHVRYQMSVSATVGEEEEERQLRPIGQSPTTSEGTEPHTSDQILPQTSVEDEPEPEPLQSPTKKSPPPVATKPKPKVKPKRNKVMFKEEVEDIPSYEPRIDDEAPPTGEEPQQQIPSSVAALKEMLFGQAETQKYSKEGPMSLRFGAFVDTEDYDEDLHDLLTPTQPQQPLQLPTHGRREPPPPPVPAAAPVQNQPTEPHYQHLAEVNKNVQELEEEEVEQQQQQKVGVGGWEEGGETLMEGNEYDTPWDSKLISKFTVVGLRKQTPSPAAQRTQSFEVISHTTDLPGNMERRNVNSLERQLKSRLSPRQEMTYPISPSSPRPMVFTDPSYNTTQDSGHFTQDSDLLQSISSTLQSRSKYGSDTLLTSFSQGDVPANYYQQQGKAVVQQIKSGSAGRSARGDLERIRTQHKKAVTLPARQSRFAGTKQKAMSQSHQSVHHSSMAEAEGGGGGGRERGKRGLARKTQSVDKLQVDPATLVTYNTYTKSHTLQSLV